MTVPRETREALVAQLLGEVDDLLKRVEGLHRSLDRTAEQMSQAAAALDRREQSARRLNPRPASSERTVPTVREALKEAFASVLREHLAQLEVRPKQRPGAPSASPLHSRWRDIAITAAATALLCAAVWLGWP